MQLYGQTFSRRELEARVGRLEQIGGVRRLRYSDGPEADSELIQVQTGAGLSYEVTPNKGLDISLTQFGGAPLSWQAPPGNTHPAFFDATGMQWLRTASGGLLMTCGLTQVGSPNEDQGESLGLHGRAHHLPARQVVAEGRWAGDEYTMRVAGVLEEAAIFGAYLRLTREIRSRLGQNRIEISDLVENLGFEPAPHMILYHFNFGFPLLSPATELTFPSRRVEPREPETPLEGYDRWQPPEAGYQERVYYHHEPVTHDGWADVTIRNPAFPSADGGSTRPLLVRLSWAVETLPRLVQWKMPGAGVHVLGIEPANCHVDGRAAERAAGALVTLEPGESVTYELALDVLNQE